MTDRKKKFRELDTRIRKAVRRHPFRSRKDVSIRKIDGTSYLEVRWDGKGRRWQKLSDRKISRDSGFSIQEGATYRYEARFFFPLGNDGKAGTGWGKVTADNHRKWSDLEDGQFFGVARLTGADDEESPWTELKDNDSFPTSREAAKRVIAALPPSYRFFRNLGKIVILTGLITILLLGAKHFELELRELLDRGGNTGEGPSKPTTPEPQIIVDQNRETALEEDLAAAEARARNLEAALERERLRAQQSEGELEALRAASDTSADRGGLPLSLQPCWVNPEGTHAEYIYDVHLSDAGIKVSKTWKAYRAADYEALPVAGVSLNQVVDRYTFAAQFVPLYDRSVEQNCRHFVRVYEGDHEGVDLYKAQRDAVESFFYIYRPHRTRY